MKNNPFDLMEKIIKEANESTLFDNGIYYMINIDKYIFRDRFIDPIVIYNMLSFDFISKVGNCKHQGEKAVKYTINKY